MGDMAEPALACPQCGGPITPSDVQYSCDACGRSWAVVDGIPHFVSDAPYWGEIPESKLCQVLDEIKTRPWQEVFCAAHDPEITRAFPFIANLNRVNWQYLLPSGRGRAALCVGEGMGTTAHALAANYSTVVAIEPVLARVEFMRLRFRQAGIDNIRIVRASFPDVPYGPGSFDLVAFNGILEWLPSGQPTKAPKDVQLAALRKAFTLLRPGGALYLGIENRWCYEYFLGAADPHVGLPWVTIVPRTIANWLTTRATGRRYDTYLYGSRGYRRLISKAGFTKCDVFVAKDSYNHPVMLVPISGRPSAYFFRAFEGRPASVHRRLLHAAAARLGLLAHMQYAFVVIGIRP